MNHYDFTTCQEAKESISALFDMTDLEGLRRAQYFYSYVSIFERDGLNAPERDAETEQVR